MKASLDPREWAEVIDENNTTVHPDEWEEFKPSPNEGPTSHPIAAMTTGVTRTALPFVAPIAGYGSAAMKAINSGNYDPNAFLSAGKADTEELKEDWEKAAAANPKTALTANLVGAIANPAFAGAKSLTGIAGASALQRAGESDLSNPEEVGRALNTGTIEGLAGYGIGKGASGAITHGARGVKTAGRLALEQLGPTTEAIRARVEGRAKNLGRTFPKISKELASVYTNLNIKGRKLANAADNLLSSDKSVPKQKLLDIIDRHMAEIKGEGPLVGEVDKDAYYSLEGLRNDLEKHGDLISPKQVKKNLKSIRKVAKYGEAPVKKANLTNEYYKRAAHDIDEVLKGPVEENSLYRQAMKPVEEVYDALDKVAQHFSLKKGGKKGTVSSKSTSHALKRLHREEEELSREALQDFSKLTDRDFASEVEDYRRSKQFDKKSAKASSRNVQLGSKLGAAAGALPGLIFGGTHADPLTGAAGGYYGGKLGKAVGGYLGGLTDIYGGPIAAKIIDTYASVGNLIPYGKFAPILEKAMQAGPKAFAIQLSVLRKNPEFMKIIEDNHETHRQSP